MDRLETNPNKAGLFLLSDLLNKVWGCRHIQNLKTNSYIYTSKGYRLKVKT